MSQKHQAASIKQRLLNAARASGEDFNLLLVRYAIERLLFRLSQSKEVDHFVLKGAALFRLWSTAPHRPTRDVDLLGFGSPDRERIEAVFRSLCLAKVSDDGLEFDPDSVESSRIKEDAEYEGVRVTLSSNLGSAVIRLQVDVGFGDAVIPPPEWASYPVVLPAESPRLLAYRQETVVAEKLHAIVALGLSNSRMKDYYDLRFLSQHFAFDGQQLSEAVRATFTRRRTHLPIAVPTGLTEEFATDDAKKTQWRAFLKRSRLEPDGLELDHVIAELYEFFIPLMTSFRAVHEFQGVWTPGGPWQNLDRSSL